MSVNISDSVFLPDSAETLLGPNLTFCKSDPWYQIWSRFNRSIWKCHLQNDRHWAQSSMCYATIIDVCYCRGPNASNPARGRTLPGQERPSNGRPGASQRRPGSMLCPVGLPGALSVDILALLLYWPTYAPITARLTCTNHSAPYAPFWHILIFYFC